MRPATVNLLCLCRDAAARLPDAVGTRADILHLIRQSQFLKGGNSTREETEALSNVISGALDRLHYESD